MSQIILRELTTSLFNKPELANVEFVVGKDEGIIYAHKILLSNKCKFLRDLFFSKNWESGHTQVTKITIPDIPYEPFKLVIKYLYSARIKLNLQMIWDVILISQKLKLQQLTEHCFVYLCERITFKNSFQFLQKSHTNGYQKVKIATLKFIGYYLDDILNIKGILYGCEEKFFKLLLQLIPFSEISQEHFLLRLIEWFLWTMQEEKNLTNSSCTNNLSNLKKQIFQGLKRVLQTSQTQAPSKPNLKGNLKNNFPSDRDMSDLIDYLLLDYLQSPKTFFGGSPSNTNEKKYLSCKKVENCIVSVEAIDLSLKKKKNYLLSKVPPQNSIKANFKTKTLFESINTLPVLNSDTSSNLKTVLKRKMSPASCLSSSKKKNKSVLILTTDNVQKHIMDVKKSISVCNDKYTRIDCFDAFHGTPTLKYLSRYDAVFLYSSIEPFADSKLLGDRLAKYSDRGGGLVISSYRALVLNSKKYKKSELFGKITSENYLPIKKGKLLDERSHLAEILDNGNPLTKGVSKFDGGMLSYRIQTQLTKPSSPTRSGSDLCRKMALWDDGNTLIALRERSNNQGRIIVLNFWPICGECYGYKGKYNYWRSFSHGRRIIANSVRYASQI
ncbi:btb/poz domain-containing protein [Anaeramoeba flamelloides]|uniref:Btb/poz domain-containing protein n=1 Tax=Anaeramoeba flamelloides TaxID=1746091 RepID=A0AAV7ZEC5_9EUKA|nr:btb/poz domain-containing protein [Anaeramoeba flamelloides]|eukprot:Anaeramoba_flamelloidesa1056929_183.p1 GENE.a1056929_183~~a1056929_183.p1  ORF type:complete len:629 (-),score=124.30 a1056929_183:217-2052(-)